MNRVMHDNSCPPPPSPTHTSLTSKGQGDRGAKNGAKLIVRQALVDALVRLPGVVDGQPAPCEDEAAGRVILPCSKGRQGVLVPAQPAVLGLGVAIGQAVQEDGCGLEQHGGVVGLCDKAGTLRGQAGVVDCQTVV